MVETNKLQQTTTNACPVTSTKQNIIQTGEALKNAHEHQHHHIQEQPIVEQRPVQHVIQEQVVPIQKNIEHDTVVNKQRMGEQVQVVGHEQAELKRQQELQRLQQNNKPTQVTQSKSHSKETLAPVVAGCQKEVVKDVVVKPEISEHHRQDINTTVEKPIKQVIHQQPVVQESVVHPTIVQHEKQPPMNPQQLNNNMNVQNATTFNKNTSK
ncbi:hypothetical protein ABK040_006794 [Willaertia magna]